MHKVLAQNCRYTGARGRESLYDIAIPDNWNGTVIVFIHGYMGFKDWGCWNLVSDLFVEHQYGFVKYNVSHNGGTVDEPIDFPDTEAFANNSYSNELTDFECMVKEVERQLSELKSIYVIGHSRGGGIAALQSGHPSVSKWASWAGISDIESRFPAGEALEDWRSNTFRYIKNGRTKQEMPHHFDQYLDFEANKDRLNIENYCKSNSRPGLILHGSDDTSVLPEEGKNLAEWTNTQLHLIPDAQHTFNSSHPWTQNEMPDALHEACRQTLLFFNT